ncbi:DeoR/GlpR family DNA-binding transcription regulator [Spirochaeta isovalerica]|uniref:DeoR/GlpR family transcriptional regulator of sugar metabolism n=1 Tax=Spirochaeta isovalerica TaxID=150 RepID=A0A841R3Y6_9SPIO|nr:DeoR/GlpR family DNA-binding transcription regulator [Spirochaeta isovalerica]MBB6479794.1 DeoR/GlpR family transcriptional regulator of sugar metabolism [Spirochaeta isovalerica]
MINRHEQILNIVNRENEVSVNRLAELLKVSLVTIRSDLRALEEEKLLMRTHGGAALPPVDDITHRLSINFPTKKRIAAAAADLVKDGETILLEAGSTISLMARFLAERKDLNVITNNAFVARQFKNSLSVNVILMGGLFQKESETLVGPLVAEYLSYYNFSKVFLGMDGFTSDEGLMCRDLERAEVMARFVEKGETIYVLSDSGKFGKTAVRTVCPPGDIDCIITDGNLEESYRTFFTGIGTEILEV